MKRINLYFDFIFPSPSINLPHKIKNSLIPLEGVKVNKTLNFFKPPHVRNPDSISTEKLSEEAISLTHWLETGFPSMLVAGYPAEIGKQVMSGLLWILPDMTLDDPVVQVTAKTLALALIYDDILDTEGKFIVEEFRPAKEKMIKSVLALLRLGLEMDLYAAESIRVEPFIQQFCILILKNFMDLGLTNPGDLANRIASQISTVASNMMACEWISNNQMHHSPRRYSMDVARRFRVQDDALPLFAEHFYNVRYGPLPSWLLASPQFQVFKSVACHISSGLNDVLGLKKDIIKGEPDGMIMLRIAWGETPLLVLEDELKILQEYIEDYMNLRDELCTNFPEAVNYVEMVDSYIYGCFQAMNNSTRYLLDGVIRLGDNSSGCVVTK